jgi:hypothetical protein
MNIHFLLPGEHTQLCKIAKQPEANFLVEYGLIVDSLNDAITYMTDVVDVDRAFLVFHKNTYRLTFRPDYFIQCETTEHAREVRAFIEELIATH